MMLRKSPFIILVLMIFTATAALACNDAYSNESVRPSVDTAEERALAFGSAVNYDYREPEKIYEFLSSEFKEKMSEKDFVKAFNKERSYPYLTPLFINYRSVEMSANKEEGKAIYSQAARLPGMIYEVELVYENENYYVYAFEDFLDGSYLEKFDNLTYSLDSYFDFK